MFTWSPAASTTPLDVLPADSGVVDLFLHPQALGLLHNWVQSQPLADAWRLPAYSLTDLAQHMGMLLPANWWQRSQLGDQQSLQVPWRDGQQVGQSTPVNSPHACTVVLRGWKSCQQAQKLCLQQLPDRVQHIRT